MIFNHQSENHHQDDWEMIQMLRDVIIRKDLRDSNKKKGDDDDGCGKNRRSTLMMLYLLHR